MAEIVIDGVTKVYPNGVRAVAPVSLTIDDGEFVVLVGPSGCGKSTLLRMIAGLETISAGRLSMDGATVNDVPARDRDVAMVFQNYALYPHMTVRDNMAFGLKMRGTPRAQIAERVAEAARMLGLDALLDRKPAQLSGGQRQRVALGRAVVRQPRVFLFDEPLSNLDAKLRGETRAELIRLHRRLHATCIYVTHDQTEAMSMGDRVVVLRDGMVQQQGAPLEIYREPANEFVAGFLGSPPMNLLAAEVTPGAGERIDLRGDAFAITADGALAARARLRAQAGDTRVTFGVRPEHFREVVEDASLSGAGDVRRADDVVRAEVLFVEPLGSEVLATCRLGGREIVARLAPDTRVAAGAAVSLRINLAHTRLFDPTTGERV